MKDNEQSMKKKRGRNIYIYIYNCWVSSVNRSNIRVA